MTVKLSNRLRFRPFGLHWPGLSTLYLSLAMAGTPAAAQQASPADLVALQARSIGPAGMSGRIAAIEAVEADPNTIFVGAATGGLWKSVNGGQT
jgi:hypothetical protein